VCLYVNFHLAISKGIKVYRVNPDNNVEEDVLPSVIENEFNVFNYFIFSIYYIKGVELSEGETFDFHFIGQRGTEYLKLEYGTITRKG